MVVLGELRERINELIVISYPLSNDKQTMPPKPPKAKGNCFFRRLLIKDDKMRIDKANFLIASPSSSFWGIINVD